MKYVIVVDFNTILTLPVVNACFRADFIYSFIKKMPAFSHPSRLTTSSTGRGGRPRWCRRSGSGRGPSGRSGRTAGSGPEVYKNSTEVSQVKCINILTRREPQEKHWSPPPPPPPEGAGGLGAGLSRKIW